MKRTALVTFGGVLLLCGILAGSARAQDAAPVNPEIERLKALLASQQQQIDQLRHTLEEEQKALEEASRPQPPSLGQVASTTPVIPAGNVAPVLHPGLPMALSTQVTPDEAPSPLQIHIGTATITPVGFLDFTSVFRSSDEGSGIGSSFGSTPYNNASTGLGKVSEEG